MAGDLAGEEREKYIQKTITSSGELYPVPISRKDGRRRHAKGASPPDGVPIGACVQVMWLSVTGGAITQMANAGLPLPDPVHIHRSCCQCRPPFVGLCAYAVPQVFAGLVDNYRTVEQGPQVHVVYDDGKSHWEFLDDIRLRPLINRSSLRKHSGH